MPTPPPTVISQFKVFPAPQPALLTVYLANVTAYYQDTVDLTSLAKLAAAPINTASLAANNFFPLEVVADIVQINNDTTVKGLYLSKNLVTKSAPIAPAGTMISDATITGFRHDIFKILYPDPMAPATAPTNMEIGSITAEGTSGKTVPPGGPQVIGGGDWAITGGTGAFLGVTGQLGGQGSGGVQPPAPGGAIRAASVTEDPSKRRANASPNDTATMFLNVIPLMPPQILGVFHADPQELVTQIRPAHVGDSLVLYATGLGPVRDAGGHDVPIGQPFPATATVISPVTVTIGNTTIPIAPQSALGVPGFSNGYSVQFNMPAIGLPSPGETTIQISSAWIQSVAVKLYI